MTDETEYSVTPNPERPDMSLNGRSGFYYEIEEGQTDSGDTCATAVVTLPNGTKFIVELTDALEIDREKIVEDAVVSHEIIHEDPAVQVRAGLPPTTPEEI